VRLLQTNLHLKLLVSILFMVVFFVQQTIFTHKFIKMEVATQTQEHLQVATTIKVV
jgi:hypothetical protein